MSAVDVWLVHRSMQGSNEILPALVGHLHVLQQAFAQDNALLDEPFCPWEMTLACVFLVPRFAMLQNNQTPFFLHPRCARGAASTLVSFARAPPNKF